VTQPDDDDGATTGRADEDGEPDEGIAYEPPAGQPPYSSDLSIEWDEPRGV
jgi:hypothetical protein